MSDFTLIRDAKVEVKSILTPRTTAPQAEIIVNDKYVHRFPAKSRVSKHLAMMQPKDLADRLTGGSFFFVDRQGEDKLVDFRDGSYNGFIHADATVSQFMDLLGFQDFDQLPMHRTRRGHTEEGTHIALRKVWSDQEIVVPGYKAGNEFSTALSFVWNPYVKTINSTFDLVRLICTNGMVGLTPFLNTKIPLFNRWEEHLDIASRQIQNKINGMIIDRVQTMGSERTSVGQCLLLEQHAYDRLYSPAVKTSEERSRLLTLMAALSPSTHLKSTYQPEVFANKQLAAQLPAHLTNLDVWNIATEMRSHTSGSAKSSDHALDRFANGVLFEESDNMIASGGRYTAPRRSSFSDPERAFFGQMG